MRIQTHAIRAAAAVLLGATAACGPAVEVHTVVSPDASLTTLRTFHVLPAPRARAHVALPPDHPMLDNSITNRTLRAAIVRGFEGRGYVSTDSNPDFTVAYYASARERLDVTYWDYGYPWRPRWWGVRGRARVGPVVTVYTEGTVIIDVIDAKTRDLLWRGRGVAVVSDDEQQYLADIQETVQAILDKFPVARPAPVARR